MSGDPKLQAAERIDTEVIRITPALGNSRNFPMDRAHKHLGPPTRGLELLEEQHQEVKSLSEQLEQATGEDETLALFHRAR